jgi:hypothetical protein
MSVAPREPDRADLPVEPPALAQIAARVRADLWEPVRRNRGRLVLAGLALAVVVFAHVARIGSLRARIVAAAVLLVAIAAPIVWTIVERRRAKDPRRVVEGAAASLGRLEVRRALSGLALADRIAKSSGYEGVSPTLAKLHAKRSLSRIDLARLAPIGKRRGQLAQWTALALLIVGVILFAIAPARVVEGVDVALARHGKAPLPLAWLDDVVVTVHPPAYLHRDDYQTERYGLLFANHGAAMVVRGTPRRSGRTLVLADDEHEVPFLDDGSGGVVAHWSVAKSGQLRVRARFGNVVIEEPLGWELKCVEDDAPTIDLEGAPKTISLKDAGPSIPLRYDAYDDHGLREVQLVIRVGVKEDRRVLAKLDGEPKHDRGGYLLRTSDPLIKKARIPISVRIEARDNDPVTGPKWGKSAELILVPPVVGAAEADRYEAIRKARDELVDFVAQVIDAPTIDASHVAKLEADWKVVEGDVTDVLYATYGNIRIPARLVNIVRGRMRKIREALASESKAPNSATHKVTQDLVERMTIGLDEAMRALGTRDARSIAKTLADVADDGADAVGVLAHSTSDHTDEIQSRIDVDVKVLDGGGGSLRRLGELGRDLGEIVENDLRRIDRTAKQNDLLHEALSFRDLAARLRNGAPSFGGGQNPGSPGSPTDEPDESGEESEGEQQAADEESALEELTKEHGGAIGEVEDLLRDAEDPKSLESIKDEAKKRADELRQAVKDLPKNAGMKKTLEGAEASAREKAEAMAEALEKLQMGDAKERGDTAQKALEEAKDKAWIEPGAEEQLDQIQNEVQKEQDWIDDVLKKLKDQAAQKAGEQVKKVGPREKGLSEKAGEIAEESEKKAPLPEEIKNLLEEAQKKMDAASEDLKNGDAQKGLEEQRDAQRLLERARDMAKGEDQEQPGSGDNGQQIDPDDKLDIPKAEDHKGPEAFRKRVLEGLGGGSASPKLQEAIKRYAQGLIQ